MEIAMFVEPLLPVISYTISVAGIIIIALIVKEMLGIKYTMQYEDVFSERIEIITHSGLDDETQKELIIEIIRTSVTSEQNVG